VELILDFWYYNNYNLTVSGRIGRPRTGRTPNFSIRINPDVLQQARNAVLNKKKTLGQWLEEAIREKIQREQKSKSDKEVK
jgi:predicted HicB family RNase H-like nuclease